MIFARIKQGVQAHIEVRLSEWSYTTIGLAVGLRLMSSHDLFAANPGYDFMAHLAPQGAWGQAIFAVSFVRFCALVANGSFAGFRRFSPLARSICAGLQAGVWFLVGVGIYEAAPYALLWIVAAVLMASELMLSLLIAKPAGAAFQHYGAPLNGKP